uniref:Ig domain-containing protein n=1 Tax=Brucella pseudintermedia TaxID=370111 RepID=UPI001F210E26
MGEHSFSQWYLQGNQTTSAKGLSVLYQNNYDKPYLKITGVPLVAGTFVYVYDTDNFWGATVKKFYLTVIVSAPPIVVSAPTSLDNGKVGLAYATKTITATGGTGPYTFKTSGTLPPGLTLNASTGAFSGTPTTAGTYTFWLGATDSEGFGGEATGTNGWRQYTLTIAPRPTITITPTSLDNGKVGLAYATKTITAT